MTILCGSDFTENAALGLRAGAAIAMRFGEPVELIHVADRLAPGDRERLQASLDAEGARVRGLGVEARTELREGIPDEVLVGSAENLGASAIVLSALGRRAAAQWLLGSVVDRVAQTSPVPVVVVRDAAPFEEWARADRPLRLFLGLDPAHDCETVISWAKRWTSAGPCKISAGHVYWALRDEAEPREPAPAELDAARADLERKLKAHLGELAPALVLRSSLGRSAEPLCEMASAERADLLVMGNHQRTGMSRLWHGSVSRDVLHVFRGNAACVPVPRG